MTAQTVFRAATGTVHAVSQTAIEANGWRPSLVCGTRVRAGVEIMADTAAVSCRTCRTRRGQANGPTAAAMRLQADDDHGAALAEDARRDAVLATAEHRAGDRVGIVRGVLSAGEPYVYTHGTVVRVTETWRDQVEYVVRDDIDGAELIYRPYLLRAVAPVPTVAAQDVRPGMVLVDGDGARERTVRDVRYGADTVRVLYVTGPCDTFRRTYPLTVR